MKLYFDDGTAVGLPPSTIPLGPSPLVEIGLDLDDARSLHALSPHQLHAWVGHWIGAFRTKPLPPRVAH